MENDIVNFTLEELSEIEGLSRDTLNTCQKNGFTNLFSIVDLYSKDASFENIKQFGIRPHLELLKIYHKYSELISPIIIDNIQSNQEDAELSDLEMQRNPIILHESDGIQNINPIRNDTSIEPKEKNTHNLSLAELSEIEKLSIRTQNICRYNDLLDINAILEYYSENGTFLNARNCGRKSHLELLQVYEKYKDFQFSIKEKSIEEFDSFQQKIETLTAKQKLIINNFIELKLSTLSVRGGNALKVKLNRDYSLSGLKSILLMKKAELMKIQFVGNRTVNEIASFVDEVNGYVELVSSLKNESEISFEVFKTYLSKKFSLEDTKLEEIATDYDFSNGLPIFKIINVLLDNYCLFEERDTEIFKLGFNYFNGVTSLSLDEIADKLILSRERIRQLKVSIFEEFNTTFGFVRELGFSGINLYGVDINSDYIVIDEELEDEINKTEQTNFNSMFITKILSVILNEKYSLIGDEYGILFDKTRRNSHNWIHTYLISKNHSNKIDFIQFIENANLRLSEKIEESYSFHFQTYLLEFKKEDFLNEIDKIAQIAEYILFQECGLSVNIEDSIEFAKNTYKPVIEYVYEALEEINKPLTVYELYNIIEEKHPGITKSADALRGNLSRATNLIYFGRSSTYGLKIWEDEQTIKGGTIRDIVEEFLENQDTPIHIDKVTEYVNQFRNTNSKNIYSNLQMHEDKKFTFFKGLLVGLAKKEYNVQNFIDTKEIHRDRKTFSASLESFKQFTEENGRLPSSIGSESEIKLYRFMNMQLYRTINNPEKEKNKKEVLSIVSKFDYVKRKRLSPSKTEDTYNELLKFISQFRRLPMAKIKDEKALYNFFYRQRKLYSEQKLSTEFVNKFMEVINTIKSYYEN